MNNDTQAESQQFSALDCQDILRSHGKSFHFSGKFLNAVQFQDCARLYAFCRYLDDLVDASPSTVEAAVTMDAISREITTGRSDRPIVQDFFRLAQVYQLDHDIVLELIRGLRSDLDPVAVQNWDQLLRYCYRVAGTVGLLMAKILGAEHTHACFHAIDLGIAMQLTNISRDIAEDALSGRRYVPSCLLPNLSPAEIAAPDSITRKKLAMAVSEMLTKADYYYRSGETGLAYLPTRAHLAILISSRIYHAIGTELRRRNCATWQGRVFVSSQRKVLISLRTLLTFLRQRATVQRRPTHQANLHQALTGLPQTHTAQNPE